MLVDFFSEYLMRKYDIIHMHYKQSFFFLLQEGDHILKNYLMYLSRFLMI